MRSNQSKAVVLAIGITGLTGAAWAVKQLLNKIQYDDLGSEFLIRPDC